jgi:hypothetical protein
MMRAERFAQWDKLGVERVKADLLQGGHKLVGGTAAVQRLAWKWVELRQSEQRAKEAKPDEILMLKPNFMGLGIDFNAGWRKLSRWFARHRS